jgi:hypothetical protein
MPRDPRLAHMKRGLVALVGFISGYIADEFSFFWVEKGSICAENVVMP